MNIDTGELKQIQAGYESLFEKVSWVKVPEELEEEASEEMKKAKVAGVTPIVPLDGEAPLSQFRRDELRKREKEKNRRRRKNKAARKAKRR